MNLPVNEYGQVDVRNGVPVGFSHIQAKRLTVTCAAIDISCAPALTGWKSGKWGGPEIFGVVVKVEDEQKVREAMTHRAAKRLTLAQKASKREAQHDADAAEFAANIRTVFPSMPDDDVLTCSRHATEIGSGRVGRSSNCDDAIRFAVAAYARHTHTNYDANFEFGMERDENRTQIGGEVKSILTKWEGR